MACLLSFTAHLRLAMRWRSHMLKQLAPGRALGYGVTGRRFSKGNCLLVLYIFCLLLISWSREDRFRGKESNNWSFFAQMHWRIMKDIYSTERYISLKDFTSLQVLFLGTPHKGRSCPELLWTCDLDLRKACCFAFRMWLNSTLTKLDEVVTVAASCN